MDKSKTYDLTPGQRHYRMVRSEDFEPSNPNQFSNLIKKAISFESQVVKGSVRVRQRTDQLEFNFTY